MFSRGIFRRLSYFVPEHKPPDKVDLQNFHMFLETYQRILILTGAGVSTESGIPDYRSEDVGTFARTSYRPIQYSDFVKNAGARRRFWARNFVGWPRFRSLRPNANHMFISNFLTCNSGSRLITQNVDGLDAKAGSSGFLELHGNAYWVRCMNCEDTISRIDFQNILEDKNPDLKPSFTEIRPDGDVEISEELIEAFEVPSCEKCGGILKPTVVFFGESIPEVVVKKAEALVDDCDSMLILGSSISTLSSYRLVEQAYDMSKYLCLINIGETRIDKMVDMKISGKISDMLIPQHTAY